MSKRDFYLRYSRGEFGNRPCSFIGPSCVEDAKKSGIKAVGIRVQVPSGRFDPYVPLDDVEDRIKSFMHDGYRKELIELSEMQDDDKIILQGYLTLGPELTLEYSCQKTQMRAAMRGSTQIRGLSANLLLKSIMCPVSWDWLQYLLNYRGNNVVIELSIYSCPVGILGWNTIFWEVRDY